jgi:hypothetical protein
VRPSGALLGSDTLLAPSPPYPRRGRRGINRKRGVAATAQATRPVSPPECYGVKLAGINSGWSEATTMRRRISDPHDSMDAGVRIARRRLF